MHWFNANLSPNFNSTFSYNKLSGSIKERTAVSRFLLSFIETFAFSLSTTLDGINTFSLNYRLVVWRMFTFDFFLAIKHP